MKFEPLSSIETLRNLCKRTADQLDQDPYLSDRECEKLIEAVQAAKPAKKLDPLLPLERLKRTCENILCCTSQLKPITPEWISDMKSVIYEFGSDGNPWSDPQGIDAEMIARMAARSIRQGHCREVAIDMAAKAGMLNEPETSWAEQYLRTALVHSETGKVIVCF